MKNQRWYKLPHNETKRTIYTHTLCIRPIWWLNVNLDRWMKEFCTSSGSSWVIDPMEISGDAWLGFPLGIWTVVLTLSVCDTSLLNQTNINGNRQSVLLVRLISSDNYYYLFRLFEQFRKWGVTVINTLLSKLLYAWTYRGTNKNTSKSVFSKRLYKTTVKLFCGLLNGEEKEGK